MLANALVPLVFSVLAPVTGGTSSSDTAVVALAFGDSLVCSGTMIAPQAVLTAAHCVAGARLPDVVIGGAVAGGAHHTALAAFVHPDFDAQTLDHDVAIVIVGPLTGVTPIPYATALDGAAAGSAIRVVGYGWTVASDPSPPLRRTGRSVLDAVDALRLVSHAAPSQACEGDSGGPALFDGGSGERVLGVASSGDTGCTQFARHTRVDIHADFIADIVARSSAGAAGAGERCWYAENCAAGACLPALDEPRWSFCAPACADDDECPSGLACITAEGEARCRHRAPSPGAEGAVCAAGLDCAGALCLASESGGERVCTTRCFSDLPGFACPDGETCRAADDGGEACFAAGDDGGCHATRGSPAALAFVVLVLLAWGRPRRNLRSERPAAPRARRFARARRGARPRA